MFKKYIYKHRNVNCIFALNRAELHLQRKQTNHQKKAFFFLSYPIMREIKTFMAFIPIQSQL